MAQDDFGEGFQALLQEKSTEEIKFDLIANKIVDPEKRALAVIEIERRREDSELSQVKADLADCQKRLRHQKWVGSRCDGSGRQRFSRLAGVDNHRPRHLPRRQLADRALTQF